MFVGQPRPHLATRGARSEAGRFHARRDAPLEADALRASDLDRADRSFLRMRVAPEYEMGPRPIRFADLFCGCGGLSLGVFEAARTLGRGARVELALDNDSDALAVYRKTFGVDRARASLVDLSVS